MLERLSMRWRYPPAWLLIASIAALGTGCAAGPRSIDPPEVRVVGLSVIEAGVDGQRFRVNLLVDNPNPVPIAVRELEFRVRLAGEGLLAGRTTAPFTLPARGTQTISTEVFTDLVSSLTRLLALVQGPSDALEYQIMGVLHPQRRFQPAIPFDFRGRVPLTATP